MPQEQRMERLARLFEKQRNAALTDAAQLQVLLEETQAELADARKRLEDLESACAPET